MGATEIGGRGGEGEEVRSGSFPSGEWCIHKEWGQIRLNYKKTVQTEKTHETHDSKR